MIYYIALCNMCKLLLIAIIVIDLVIAMCYILVEVINMDNALRFLTDAALGCMREELPGTVKLIFQPAEEKAPRGGARPFLAAFGQGYISSICCYENGFSPFKL